MTFKISYLGMFVDQTGKTDEEISTQGAKLSQLRQAVFSKYPILEDLPHNFVVNHEIVHDDIDIKAEDEIALLPPFAGG